MTPIHRYIYTVGTEAYPSLGLMVAHMETFLDIPFSYFQNEDRVRVYDFREETDAYTLDEKLKSQWRMNTPKASHYPKQELPLMPIDRLFFVGGDRDPKKCRRLPKALWLLERLKLPPESCLIHLLGYNRSVQHPLTA